MSFRKSCLGGLFGVALLAGASTAATITEDSGNFSNDWTDPTLITTGTTGVAGTGGAEWSGGDRFDVFHFSGLRPGATSFVFDFALTAPYAPNAYANGGGSIYYSFAPFTGSYYVDQGNGSVLGSQDLLGGVFDVTYNPWNLSNPASQGTSRFTLDLDDSFAGELFLALDFTYGKVTYNITAPAWAAVDLAEGGNDLDNVPGQVPLPAGVWMLLAGLSGLGVIATRRKRA